MIDLNTWLWFIGSQFWPNYDPKCHYFCSQNTTQVVRREWAGPHKRWGLFRCSHFVWLLGCHVSPGIDPTFPPLRRWLCSSLKDKTIFNAPINNCKRWLSDSSLPPQQLHLVIKWSVGEFLSFFSFFPFLVDAREAQERNFGAWSLCFHLVPVANDSTWFFKKLFGTLTYSCK